MSVRRELSSKNHQHNENHKPRLGNYVGTRRASIVAGFAALIAVNTKDLQRLTFFEPDAWPLANALHKTLK
jgi:hypothetical protein